MCTHDKTACANVKFYDVLFFWEKNKFQRAIKCVINFFILGVSPKLKCVCVCKLVNYIIFVRNILRMHASNTLECAMISNAENIVFVGGSIYWKCIINDETGKKRGYKKKWVRERHSRLVWNYFSFKFRLNLWSQVFVALRFIVIARVRYFIKVSIY